MPPRAALTLLLIAAPLFAQAPTMKQLMLDLIHPASNDILLSIARGGPTSETDWATLRYRALALQQSAEVLLKQNAAPSWQQSAKMLADAASDAYRAAQAKDAKALSVIPARLDASCTNCHKQYRPNVFPPPEGRVQ